MWLYHTKHLHAAATTEVVSFPKYASLKTHRRDTYEEWDMQIVLDA